MSLTPVNPVAQARKKYRRAMRARQTTLWVVLIGSMLGVGLIAAAVFSGTLKGPWDRPFTSPSASQVAVVRQPCPSSDKARYINPKKITINVLNGTDTAGLAARVQTDLKGRGFKVPTVGNDESGITSAAVIRSSADQVDAAYTLATQVPGEVIMQTDQRTTKDLDLILGDGFTSLKPVDQAKINTKQKIQAVAGCVVIKAEPIPADTPSATPTSTKKSKKKT